MAKIITEASLQSVINGDDSSLRHQAYNTTDVCITREVWDALSPRLDADTARIYHFSHACQQPALAMALRGVLIDPRKRAEVIRAHEEEEDVAQREAAELAGDAWDARENRVGRCTPAADYTYSKAETKAGFAAGGHVFAQHSWPRDVDAAVAVCKRCGSSRLVAAPLNAGSPSQIASLLYDKLKVRVRRNRQTHRPTADDEALESIAGEATRLMSRGGSHQQIGGICRAVLRARKARKQIGYARSSLGSDGRMRSSFNVGAAETGRWSASKAPDWKGWNIQQISKPLRSIVIADPGLELWNADLKSAESDVVAHMANDEAYIRAHQTADIHTAVAALTWPDLPWRNDWLNVDDCGADPHATDGSCCDKGLAETPTHFDPYHTYRLYAKSITHGCNLGRSPAGIARSLHVAIEHAEKVFATIYDLEHGAFPQVVAQQQRVAAELKRTGIIRSPLGRKRQFFGRTWDADTVREALAQIPQSTIADILNLALLRIWLELDTRLNIWDAPHASQPNSVWLLAQGHDAILGLRRIGDDVALHRVKELMTFPVRFPSGKLRTIPVDIGVGPNWKDLKKWNG